jgi:predicted RNA methylase
VESRKLLAQNQNGQKVEVVHADAFEYLPPKPIDEMICEMIRVAMLREKQVKVVESLKQKTLPRAVTEFAYHAFYETFSLG